MWSVYEVTSPVLFFPFFYLHSTSGYEELLRHVYSNKTMLVLGGGLGCLWM